MWEHAGKVYHLFLDLDGVLVDFDRGVKAIFGRGPSEIPDKEMWPVLAKTRNFYLNLDWMPDGKLLWEAVKGVNPVIVSGVPWGNWAEPQKRQWCRRELGPEVPVVLCRSREKGKAVADLLGNGEIPVLIDDRLQARESWLDIGGIYILHSSARQSLAELARLGFPLPT